MPLPNGARFLSLSLLAFQRDLSHERGKGGLSGIKRRKVFFFFIRVGFDGLFRWVEWHNEALGVFFPSGWDLMDC